MTRKEHSRTQNHIFSVQSHSDSPAVYDQVEQCDHWASVSTHWLYKECEIVEVKSQASCLLGQGHLDDVLDHSEDSL